jgi:hypothetical protein
MCVDAGDTKQALALVDEGLEHTPTFIDNYMLKARIYRVCHPPPRSASTLLCFCCVLALSPTCDVM